jgi:3-methyladenine DNA glycosylase/8-oxoguanine DNA glycosylase
VSGGILDIALRPGGARARLRVAQRPDGALEAAVVEGEPEAAVAALRAALLLDVDTGPFAERVRDDPLLGEIVRRRPGMRPVGRGTVAQSLVMAMAGQLITWREAAAIERRVVRRASPAQDRGVPATPPDRAALAALSPAQLATCGLTSSRATVLLRLLRGLDPEALRRHDSAAVAARLGRERGVGAWSAAVVGLYGLGRLDLGLVGDLGLLRLLGRRLGRRATVEETADLLRGYGEWAGLASLYLLSHPLASASGSSRAARAAVRG